MSIGAIPTIDSAIPVKPAINPLSMSFPESAAMIVSEKTATEKYSAGPKSKHTFASNGLMNINASIPRIEPMNEYRIPTPNARPASPFSAIGPPSNTVEIDEGVPGIFRSIAEMSPPDIPPM